MWKVIVFKNILIATLICHGHGENKYKVKFMLFIALEEHRIFNGFFVQIQSILEPLQQYRSTKMAFFCNLP